MDAPTTANKAKAIRLWPTGRLTSVSVNTRSNSSPTQSQTKIVGSLRPNAVFSFLCSPCPCQSCLSRFSHQTLYTNIEGTRRHKSVPTILTETVASFMCVYNYCVVWYNGKYIYFFLARIYFRRYWIYTAVQSTDPLSADQLRNL